MCQACHLIGRALAAFADESARIEALRRDSSSAFLISRDCPENAATIGAVRAAAEQAIAQREADAAHALGRALVSACVQSIGDGSHRRAEFRHGASEVPHVRDDGGAGDIAGEDQRISRMVAGFLDGLASGFHESSSSVGGAASAARVIGGFEQPTEEVPTREAGAKPPVLLGVAAQGASRLCRLCWQAVESGRLVLALVQPGACNLGLSGGRARPGAAARGVNDQDGRADATALPATHARVEVRVGLPDCCVACRRMFGLGGVA